MAVLRKFQAALAGKDDQVSLVIVDNAKIKGDEHFSGEGFVDELVIAGDNSNREFSGWDHGVRALVARRGESDIWIFTNDTFATHHGWSDQRAARFGAGIRRLENHLGPWLFGEITNFPHSMITPLGPSIRFVPTYCFAMNQVLRQGLGQLSPGNALLDSLVHDHFEPDHRIFRDNVDPGYVDFILAWLIADDSDPQRKKRFGWAFEWHNRSSLNAHTFDDLRMKARCCLSETLLSVRARKFGADFCSPYDAWSARDRIRRTIEYILDKVWEKRLMRRIRKG
ncbi:hypothetical protein J7E62_00395 [Variovorax paradoxus]|nr:hypothetical protein [Variovorax paradoxus]